MNFKPSSIHKKVIKPIIGRGIYKNIETDKSKPSKMNDMNVDIIQQKLKENKLEPIQRKLKNIKISF